MGKTIGLTLEPEELLQEVSTELHACPHCDKKYKSGAALKSHCKKEHPDVFDEAAE